MKEEERILVKFKIYIYFYALKCISFALLAVVGSNRKYYVLNKDFKKYITKFPATSIEKILYLCLQKL